MNRLSWAETNQAINNVAIRDIIAEVFPEFIMPEEWSWKEGAETIFVKDPKWHNYLVLLACVAYRDSGWKVFLHIPNGDIARGAGLSPTKVYSYPHAQFEETFKNHLIAIRKAYLKEPQ